MQQSYKNRLFCEKCLTVPMMDMNIEGDESRITCKNAGFVVEWDETQKVFKAYIKAE